MLQKIWDKFKKNFTVNKKMLLFLGILFIIGILTGAIFITILKQTDKELVNTYLQEFIDNLSNNPIDYINSLKNIALNNFVLIIGVWLLGISIIGIPVIIGIFFAKSFVIGFAIGSMILKCHVKGCLLSFIYIFPHYLLTIFILSFVSIYALSFSFKMVDSVIKKKTIDFKVVMNKYIHVLLLSIIGIIFTTLWETFITPYLLKLVIPFVV